MKLFKYKGFQILAMCAILFSVISCQEDSLDLDSKTEIRDGEDNDRVKQRCLNLVYPVTIVFPDGSTEAVADRKEWHEAMRGWKENHPDSDARPEMQYPVQIEYKDGETYTVESQEQMARFKKACKDDRPQDGDRDKRRCFKLVYPVTIIFPDGSTAQLADGREWREALLEWKENHPDSDAHPALEYPVDIKYKNGKIYTLETQEEMAKAKRACKDDRPDNGDMRRCFKLVYPVMIVLPDGSIQEVADGKEWHEAMREWKENHPDSDVKRELQYPVEIKFRDGRVVQVGSEDEMVRHKKACG